MDEFKPEEETLFLIATELGLIVLGEKEKDSLSQEVGRTPTLDVPVSTPREKPYSQLT